MASSPDILNELPWLLPSRRKVRRERILRHGRSTLLLAAFGAPVLLANGTFDWNGSSEAARPAKPGVDQAAPALIASPFAPKALRPLSPEEAEKWNRAVPQTAFAISPATPLAVGTANSQSYARSLQCMTQAIYYEAGNEPVEGQRAVAQVILNRVRSPVYPSSVCGVVYQGSERKTGCQFTFTCDGSLARAPSAHGWARASGVAMAALGGYVHAPVGWATHYHADYVVPYWAQSLDKLTTIGRHIFYRWNGRSGTAAGFTGRYAGTEPDIAGLLAKAGLPASENQESDRGLLQVPQTERPMIALAATTTGAHRHDPEVAAHAAAKDGAGAAAADAPTSATAPLAGARWVIGARLSGGEVALSAAAPAKEAQTAQ